MKTNKPIIGDSCSLMALTIEDVQAKTRPSHSAISANSSATDRSMTEVTRLIYENGFDYPFADAIDLVQAARSLEYGK